MHSPKIQTSILEPTSESKHEKVTKFSINYLLQKPENEKLGNLDPSPAGNFLNDGVPHFPRAEIFPGSQFLPQLANAHATVGLFRQPPFSAALGPSLQSLLASASSQQLKRNQVAASVGTDEKLISPPSEWVGKKQQFLSPNKSPNKTLKRSSSADLCLNISASSPDAERHHHRLEAKDDSRDDLSPNAIMFGHDHKSPSPLGSSNRSSSPIRTGMKLSSPGGGSVTGGSTGTQMHHVTRKLGRNPRVPFSSAQVAILEQKYQVKQYLSSIDVAELSALLSLNDSRVKIWFQNRRARARKEQQMGKGGCGGVPVSANPNVTITKHMSASNSTPIVNNTTSQLHQQLSSQQSSPPKQNLGPDAQGNTAPSWANQTNNNNNNNNFPPHFSNTNNNNNNLPQIRPQPNIHPAFSPFANFCSTGGNSVTSPFLRPPIGQLLVNHNSGAPQLPPNAFTSPAMNLAAHLIQTSRTAVNSSLVDGI